MYLIFIPIVIPAVGKDKPRDYNHITKSMDEPRDYNHITTCKSMDEPF